MSDEMSSICGGLTENFICRLSKREAMGFPVQDESWLLM